MVFEIIMLIDAVTGESRQATTNSMELGFCLTRIQITRSISFRGMSLAVITANGKVALEY